MRIPFIFKAATAATISVAVITTASPALAQVQPGSNFDSTNIQWFSNGLAYYALLASVVGIIISASLWAMGSKGQNPGTELTGKKGIILCCTAAFFVGALPSLISYFEEKAQDLDTNNITSASPVIGGPTVLKETSLNGDDFRQSRMPNTNVDDTRENRGGPGAPYAPGQGPTKEKQAEATKKVIEQLNRNPISGKPYGEVAAPKAPAPAVGPVTPVVPGPPFREGQGPAARPLPIFTPDGK